MRPLAAAALASALALSACGSSRVSITGEVKYGKTAEDNYQAGVAEMKSESWTEATKFLEYVRTKYPFSMYAPLAELRLADIKVAQDRLIEAAEAYATFARMHPTHEEADYAAFREGLALYKDAPTDFFLFPPAHERELKSMRDATLRLEAFLKKYPQSRQRAEAEKLLAEGRRQLAEHEWYAAEFYAKRGLWAGAAGRFEALVKGYPGSRHEVDAYFRMSEAWEKLDDRFKARQALQQLISRHPDDPRRAQAEQRLAALR
jgi:outer membrane protein assembly factor BamD